MTTAVVTARALGSNVFATPERSTAEASELVHAPDGSQCS
jgi:hypothetical protein